MAYTLEQLSADCHAAMAEDSGDAGREKVRDYIAKACGDADFVAEHFENPGQPERHILYEDPEFNFCILAHSYNGAKGSNPHNHADSWAIYGQAKGETIMTDWECVEEPKDGNPGKVKKVRDYKLTPGIAHYYKVGALHSPRRENDTRLIRVEGKNLAGVKRDKYEVAA